MAPFHVHDTVHLPPPVLALCDLLASGAPADDATLGDAWSLGALASRDGWRPIERRGPRAVGGTLDRLLCGTPPPRRPFAGSLRSVSSNPSVALDAPPRVCAVATAYVVGAVETTVGIPFRDACALAVPRTDVALAERSVVAAAYGPHPGRAFLHLRGATPWPGAAGLDALASYLRTDATP